MKHTVYDVHAPKKAKNLYVNSSLLDYAQQLDINVSRACEQGLLTQIAEIEARKWREENRVAIESSNQYVATHGLPLAKFQKF